MDLDGSTIPLKEIDSSEPIYRGEDDEGGLDFRTNVSHRVGKYNLMRVLGAPLVALGLTEICRKIGKGKIYWMPKPVNTGYTQYKKGTAGVYIFRQLPDLIYQPIIWGPKDDEVWDALSHNARLRILNGRAGALKGKECVMPIGLTYDPIEKEIVRFNGYHTENYGCKAILCIVPKAYLGWCTQLREGAIFECGGGKSEERWWNANLAVLERYRALNAEVLVRRLWEMYHEGEARALSEFGDILAAVREWHRQWAPIALADRQE